MYLCSVYECKCVHFSSLIFFLRQKKDTIYFHLWYDVVGLFLLLNIGVCFVQFCIHIFAYHAVGERFCFSTKLILTVLCAIVSMCKFHVYGRDIIFINHFVANYKNCVLYRNPRTKMVINNFLRCAFLSRSLALSSLFFKDS